MLCCDGHMPRHCALYQLQHIKGGFSRQQLQGLAYMGTPVREARWSKKEDSTGSAGSCKGHNIERSTSHLHLQAV